MPKLPVIKIINPREKKKAGEKKKPFQAMSSESLQELQAFLNKGKKAIIFINRRGLATSIICQDCSFVPKCPHCDIPLSFHLPASLICHHCGYQTLMPNTCPSCHGYRLKPLGIGMERISEELKKFINPLPQFSLIEGEMPDTEELKIFDKFNKGEIKILIGTEALLRPQLEKADLAIAASIDPLLFLPDYNSEERIFFYLLRLRKIAKEKLIIQTLIPENKIFQYLIKEQEGKFFKEGLMWRENYLWPPFVQLIKLTFSHPNEAKGNKETAEVRNKLDQVISKTVPQDLQKNFSILGPAPAFIFKEKGVYKWNILIKYKYFESKIQKNINPLMGFNFLFPLLTKDELNLRNKVLKAVSFGDNWKIDIDPKDTL
jgi:primosomal protein N' (replication factor Y) (superfamily II helicase)